jgi:hypothetical protein
MEGGGYMGDVEADAVDDPTVLLEPANPFDLSEEDLAALAATITTALPELKVEVAYDDQFGAGGPWWQVLHLWVAVTFAEAVGYDTLVEICKDWLREQFRTIHGRKRNKLLVVHELESGKEILKVRLDGKADEYVVQILEDVPRKRPRGRHRREA